MKLLDTVVFDSHLHIVDPRFPLVPNQGYVPAPFTVEDYQARTLQLPVDGGAVVSGSFQAYDQTYLADALERLGPRFAGVAQIPPEITDEEVLVLAGIGVRAFRINLVRRGAERLADLERLAPRVEELAGWHAELYVDARELPEIAPRLRRRIVIDHLGLSRAGLPALLELVERGAYVKASGFARTDHDVPAALRAIARVNPGALLFGTDLPSTRAPRPFDDSDVDLVTEALGEPLARPALHDNAVALYLRKF